jgi:hypothetical protein
MLGPMQKIGPSIGAYTLPGGLALIGVTFASLWSLVLFAMAGRGLADAMLIALTSATMAAAVFYYGGVQLLKTFGLPRDATMQEFHRFMTTDDR